MRRSGRVQAAAGLRHHDHVCWVHAGPREWQSRLVSFLVEGVARRDRLLYLADPGEEALLDHLAQLPSREVLGARGQLRTRDRAQWWEDVDRLGQSAVVSAQVDSSLAAGYAGLRVAVDATERLLASGDLRAEFELDVHAAASPVVALCGYDSDRLTDDELTSVAFLHPLRHALKWRFDEAMYSTGPATWRLTGSMDLTSAAPLHTSLAALAAIGEDAVLDLAELDFIDVAGARSLVRLAADLVPRHLVLRNAPPSLVRIIELGWGHPPGLVMEDS